MRFGAQGWLLESFVNLFSCGGFSGLSLGLCSWELRLDASRSMSSYTLTRWKWSFPYIGTPQKTPILVMETPKKAQQILGIPQVIQGQLFGFFWVDEQRTSRRVHMKRSLVG